MKTFVTTRGARGARGQHKAKMINRMLFVVHVWGNQIRSVGQVGT
jgi:hypothetical protein